MGRAARHRPQQIDPQAQEAPDPQAGLDLADLNGVIEEFKRGFGSSDDVVVRRFFLGSARRIRLILVYIDGMVDRRAVDKDIIEPLMTARPQGGWPKNRSALARILAERILPVGEMEFASNYGHMVRRLMAGNSVLLLDGFPEALVIDTRMLPHRQPEAPRAEPNVQSSFEGFTELLRTNIVLVRRRIQSPNLRVRVFSSGHESKNQIALLYIEGVVNPVLVQSMLSRIEDLGHEAHLFPTVTQCILKCEARSPFPLFRNTERPDFASQELLAGKLVLLTDNSPFAVVVPATLWDFFRTPEDYTRTSWGIAFLRLIRLLANLTGLLLPSLYIALLSVNPEFLPTYLALGILALREGLPFPPVLEVVLVLLTMEILREAAIRIPPILGTTLGVVGALILGLALAQSRVVSPLTLIVAAVTALSQFVAPAYEVSLTLRLLVWPLLASAVAFGLFGLTLAALIMLGHLCTLHSLGVPYLAPVAPLSRSILRDWIFRVPVRRQFTRPEYLRPVSRIKQKPPEPPPAPSGGQRGRPPETGGVQGDERPPEAGAAGPAGAREGDSPDPGKKGLSRKGVRGT
ncbi:MAG: spore germination protein [Acetobacteraceae bacterium]|nr:spore germination protein [Acetobacteraceae bacterium]